MFKKGVMLKIFIQYDIKLDSTEVQPVICSVNVFITSDYVHYCQQDVAYYIFCSTFKYKYIIISGALIC